MRDTCSLLTTNALYNHVFSPQGIHAERQLPNLDVSQPIVYAELSWLTTPKLATVDASGMHTTQPTFKSKVSRIRTKAVLQSLQGEELARDPSPELDTLIESSLQDTAC